MPKTLIKQLPDIKRKAADDGSEILNVSELFVDTLQGEGVSAGCPASFLRLQHCTLACVWCDTLEVWKQGNPYSAIEILDMFDESNMIDKFRLGQRLILTGGSPALQSKQLIDLIVRFEERFQFKPIIEIEHEATRELPDRLLSKVDILNCSPKLANSGMKSKIRIKEDSILQALDFKGIAIFKFVVDCEEDWQEILESYIEPFKIPREQILLMPCGDTQKQLNQTREIVADMAVRHNVRFSDRLHVTIWNQKTGV